MPVWWKLTVPASVSRSIAARSRSFFCPCTCPPSSIMRPLMRAWLPSPTIRSSTATPAMSSRVPDQPVHLCLGGGRPGIFR